MDAMSLSLPAMVATLNQFPDMAGGIFVFPKKANNHTRYWINYF